MCVQNVHKVSGKMHAKSTGRDAACRLTVTGFKSIGTGSVFLLPPVLAPIGEQFVQSTRDIDAVVMGYWVIGKRVEADNARRAIRSGHENFAVAMIMNEFFDTVGAGKLCRKGL